MCVRPHWDTEGSGKTKVSEFEIVVFIDQQVLRFEIAVENTM